jgi:YesN/AraC family two-component response regulator
MPYRLLLADDDDAARTSLHSLIRAALPQAEIDQASNAPDATALIQRHAPYHVVVTDMRMPEGTEGLTVVVAAREKDPTTEVIVLTAYGDMGNVYQALRLGANQYIDKNLPETVTAQLSAIENAAHRADRTRRAQLRLHAMERLALELDRRQPVFLDVVQTLQLMIDYAREISREESGSATPPAAEEPSFRAGATGS